MSAYVFKHPRIDSVAGRVLGALLNGDKLTSNDILSRFCASRASSHVDRLRKLYGWPIRTTPAKVVTADAGRESCIGVYSLPPESIAEAGEDGKRYALEAAVCNTERMAKGRKS